MKIGKKSSQIVRHELAWRGKHTSDMRVKAIVSHYHSLPEEDQQTIAEMIARLMTIRNMGALMGLEVIYAVGRKWNEKAGSDSTF